MKGIILLLPLIFPMVQGTEFPWGIFSMPEFNLIQCPLRVIFDFDGKMAKSRPPSDEVPKIWLENPDESMVVHFLNSIEFSRTCAVYIVATDDTEKLDMLISHVSVQGMSSKTPQKAK